MIGQKGCFIQRLSVMAIYSEGNLFVEGLLFRFLSIFNASSQLKTFSYPVISTILFHTLGHVESILYACYFISLLFFTLSLPVSLPFQNANSAQKWKKATIYKSKYRAGNITQWFYRAIKLCIISVKIYAAIMVKVTFEIKSNIQLNNVKKKFYRPPSDFFLQCVLICCLKNFSKLLKSKKNDINGTPQYLSLIIINFQIVPFYLYNFLLQGGQKNTLLKAISCNISIKNLQSKHIQNLNSTFQAILTALNHRISYYKRPFLNYSTKNGDNIDNLQHTQLNLL